MLAHPFCLRYCKRCLQYFSEVARFVRWCDENYLILNETRTVEMFFDPRSVGDHSLVIINGKSIEQVTSHKYLGVYMDNLLCCSSHVNSLCARLQQRLYFFAKGKSIWGKSEFLFLFYQSVFESLIRYGITAWYGNLTVLSKSKLTRLVQTALTIVGWEEKRPIQEMYEVSVLRQAKKIVADDAHILHVNFNMLPSDRRLRILMCQSNRFKNDFVPTAVKLFNREEWK